MINIQAQLLMDVSEFTQMSARLANLGPAFAGPVDTLMTSFLAVQFKTEGAAGGERWASLAPRTLEARKRPGHGRGGIGRDTNRLWASLVKSPSPEGWVRVTPTTYSRGTNVPYAQFFSEGTRGGLQPARPISPSPLPPWLVDSISAAVNRYIIHGTLAVESGGEVGVVGIES